MRAIVAEVLELQPSEVPPHAVLSSLPTPADDLAVVEIVLALEEHFQIELSDEELVGASGGDPSTPVGDMLSTETLAALVDRHVR